MSTKENEPYSILKSMKKTGDRMDGNDDASKSNNQLVAPQEDDGYDCQTPTSDDHKILPQQFHLPPPPPRKLLQKKRRRSSEEGSTAEFFEQSRRKEEHIRMGPI
ncbi:hypothetical protein L1887_10015 [Cichorium endivia]|nr:hypothetical protein L1887_10015 [Cichorium endivia]